MKLKPSALARAGMIASVYIVVSYILLPFSYGLIQFRAAEALVLLPMLYPEAILGVFVGCLIANIIGGLGPWDIIGGSLVTLLAAYVTYRYRFTPIAYLSPIILNAVLVGAYLSVLLQLPYWLVALSVGAGQAGVIFLLGVPLIRFLRSARDGAKRHDG